LNKLAPEPIQTQDRARVLRLDLNDCKTMKPREIATMEQSPSSQGARRRPEQGRRLVRLEPPMTVRRAFQAVARQDWAPGLCYLLMDILAWVVFFNLAVLLRHPGRTITDAREIQLLCLGLVILTLFIIGGYDRRRDMCSLTHASEHVIAMVSAAAVALLLVYAVAAFNENMRPSRSVLLLSFALFACASLSYRRSLGQILATNTAKRVFLVLGAEDSARRFFEAYQHSPNRERLRFVDVRGAAVGKPIAGLGSPAVEGDPAGQLEDLGREISAVILTDDPRDLGPAILDRLVRLHFLKLPVYTLESFYETHWRRMPVYDLAATWPLQMGFQLRRDSPYYQVKRVFDILASGVALLFLSPLLALLVLLTQLDSGRPALFRQIRVGHSERPFTLYKFRTMFVQPPPTSTAASPAGGDSLYTAADDPRITRLGRWLRKLRLDELPQLWNVLKGDMSLIGPRAEWIKCVERYEKSIPCYHFRHLVKPGITGWAQVNYPYGQSEADAVQKLNYDLYYIRHYSLRLDAMIILKTLHIMSWGKGQ
jgi:exopolysaccharide biosynthesis polyprenyl glycosylphosphotransferase